VRKLSIAAMALAALSLSPTAAQTTIPFMTVDAVDPGYGYYGPSLGIAVTGVVKGDSTPTTRTVSYGVADALNLARFEACHRSLLFALSRPGQYVAQVGNTNMVPVCNVAVITP
jgi:hypothetical protein